MQYIRLALTILFVPAYLLVGSLAASILESLTGIWNYYFAAVFTPMLGLLTTWFVAPYYKIYFVCFMYAMGIVLAFAFVFPAYYPEGHPMAYLPTYIPFIIATIWATLVTVVICAYENYRRKKL